ncbi:vacuolar protein sorting-associated protein 18 [Skeletonema marinoi]|uniref:Vacuolar protein sorting-associated protein 18 n=1 Tax=Skeletonema marinoi TaxID=267567 RepID=A0AAD8YLW8_9STRA|nr:vacuolar protein sorting-associated protein 18 [Skeletonema marinoi]
MTSLHHHHHRHLVPPSSSSATKSHQPHPPAGRFSFSQQFNDERSQQQQAPPIWSARGVDQSWHVSQMEEGSKSLGVALGIKGSGIRLIDSSNNNSSNSSGMSQSQQYQQSSQYSSGGADIAAGSKNDTTSTSGYAGLSGIMGRVLGASSQTASTSGGGGGTLASLTNDIEDEDINIPVTRQQQQQYVNRGTPGGSSNTNTPLVAKNGMPLTSLIPPLRLISRWNVRRNTTAMGTEGNQLVPLPPPVRPNATTDSANSNYNDPNFGQIVHTLWIQRDVMSSYPPRTVRKLSGFGPNPDGTYTVGFNPGVAIKDAIGTSGMDAMSKVQTGLTPGSYVTAVGWDRDRGTEGSTKRIILGTSIGELYEYALVSPNASSKSSGGGGGASSSSSSGAADESKSKLSAFDARAGELGIETDEDPIESPVLLRRLNPMASSPSSGGGRDNVGKEGGGYVVVLASFGGIHKHTRLHSFRSEPSSSNKELTLRSAFLRTAQGAGKGSFVELPGSVEFPDLRSCNNAFAMRTETGIYYGTIERMASAVSIGGGVVDAGMLVYDSILGNGGRGGSCVPSSIGVTPHHFITLNLGNEVRFINKEARKVIQKERVDWLSVSQSASGGDAHGGEAAELLMDIRRSIISHISSSCEGRDIWKYTLARCIDDTSPHHTHLHHGTTSDNSMPQKGEEKHIESQFEYAKSLCTNPSQKATLNVARAEYYLSKGRTELAAKYLAQCPSSIMPFADTSARLALPMLGMEEGNSIKANESLANSNMALITFLTDKMKSAKLKNDTVICTMLGSWLAELHLHERERDGSGKPVYLRRNHRHVPPVSHALLHQFLSSFVKDMDPKVIVNILSSHDISAGECAGFSAAAGDINAAVNAALFGEDEKAGALDALRVLNDSAIENAEPYYYKHALVLLSRAPMAAAKSFLARYPEGLIETKLLPAFMQYERQRAETKNPLVEQKNNSAFVDDENASVKYLEGVIAQGSRSRAVFNYLTSLYAAMNDEGPLSVFFPLMFRHLYHHLQTLGDHITNGEALSLSSQLYMGFTGMRQQAVELALKKRSSPWSFTRRKDIVARVVAVLKDCGPDVLSIEDVLPFLPDFAQIDQFKDEICDALASYSSKIEHYIKEMNECDQTCDTLRDELSRLRSVGVQVRTNARSLKREVLPHLNEKQRDRVKFIDEELARLRRLRATSRAPLEKAKDDFEMDELQNELDGLIAAECPLTGSVMVDSITQGFDDDDFEDTF